METMGERIKRLRLERRKTQDQVAKFCGIERATVGLWETGRSASMRPQTLFRLAELFSVSAQYIETGHGSQMPQAIAKDAAEASLIRAYRTAPEAMRRAMLALAGFERQPSDLPRTRYISLVH